MQNYNLYKIDNNKFPKDGFYFVERGNEDSLKVLLVPNNFQFVFYHQNNFMNMCSSWSGVRFYLNTETAMTQIDLLSNAILEKQFKDSNFTEYSKYQARLDKLFYQGQFYTKSEFVCT